MLTIARTSSTPTSVIGTWKAVENGFHGPELAVVQFKPDGTFIEGFDVANQASTYLGRYSYDSASQRISFIIDSASGTGPQPIPFQRQALSSVVHFGNPTQVELNNNLDFMFQSTSVDPSDFTLPAAPRFNSQPFGFNPPVNTHFPIDNSTFMFSHF